MSRANDTWEIFKDNANEWRWRRTAPNHEIVGASTEGYVNKTDCVANAERHGYSGKCELGPDDKWEFYADKAGEWRWRRTARNGEIVGASTEGYVNKSDCVENAQRNCYQ